MDQSKPVKAKEHWKQKRSRSTSSLVGVASAVTIKSDSEDTGKEANDSDDAQRSFARLSLQTDKPPRYDGSRPFKNKSIPLTLTATPSNIESDSVTELLSVLPNLRSSQQTCRRRRRFKRMAIDYIPKIETEIDSLPHHFKEPYQTVRSSSAYPADFQNDSSTLGLSKIGISSTPSTSISHSHQHHCHRKQKKKIPSDFLTFEVDTGKRKRCGRDKSSNDTVSFPIASCSSEFQSMIGIGMDLMNVDMNDDELMMSGNGEDEVSSVSSGSESIAPSCDEGREGDDEQSDWVGDEWKDEMGDSDRRALILRRLRDYIPSREIRAGKRRVHPEIPPFSMRTYANEQVSKFLQDPSQSQLRLHPMRQDERVQLSHIATLYSLQLQADDASGFPILTKTSNTTQMSACSPDRGCHSRTLLPDQPFLESESNSKRIKKTDFQ